MARYTVNHAYTSFRDGLKFGPWEADDVVELDPVDAEWVERDSPGALTADKPGKADDGGRGKPPGANRQHRGAANRGTS